MNSKKTTHLQAPSHYTHPTYLWDILHFLLWAHQLWYVLTSWPHTVRTSFPRRSWGHTTHYRFSSVLWLGLTKAGLSSSKVRNYLVVYGFCLRLVPNNDSTFFIFSYKIFDCFEFKLSDIWTISSFLTKTGIHKRMEGNIISLDTK